MFINPCYFLLKVNIKPLVHELIVFSTIISLGTYRYSDRGHLQKYIFSSITNTIREKKKQLKKYYVLSSIKFFIEL